MLNCLDPLRELTMTSLLLRLILAMLFGGLIGMERGLHGRAAGLRTYMLVCIGATGAVILSQYEYLMAGSLWKQVIADTGAHVDVSRYGAQVISGIGFLGAGTILITSHREVRGLTTAAGLWACGCMGLAIGAGFYECAVLGYLYVILVNTFLFRISERIVQSSSNMNVYVELDSPLDIRLLMQKCKELHLQVYDVDFAGGDRGRGQNPSVELLMGVPRRGEHQVILEALSDLDCVRLIDEI